MSVRTDKLDLAAPVCLDAIRGFAVALERRTPLRLAVTVEDADVAFDAAEDGGSVRLEWSRADLIEDDLEDEWEWAADASIGPPVGPDALIAHYAVTVERLARNPEASRALLGLLK
jgi:hypothetical protein